MSKCKKCKKGDLHLLRCFDCHGSSDFSLLIKFICDNCGEIKEFKK